MISLRVLLTLTVISCVSASPASCFEDHSTTSSSASEMINGEKNFCIQDWTVFLVCFEGQSRYHILNKPGMYLRVR